MDDLAFVDDLTRGRSGASIKLMMGWARSHRPWELEVSQNA
jgi:hypothetical protein